MPVELHREPWPTHERELPRRLADIAANALESMWRGSDFAAETASGSGAGGPTTSNPVPTVATLRCLEALVGAATSFPTWVDPAVRARIPEQLRTIISFDSKAASNDLARFDDPWGLIG